MQFHKIEDQIPSFLWNSYCSLTWNSLSKRIEHDLSWDSICNENYIFFHYFFNVYFVGANVIVNCLKDLKSNVC